MFSVRLNNTNIQSHHFMREPSYKPYVSHVCKLRMCNRRVSGWQQMATPCKQQGMLLQNFMGSKIKWSPCIYPWISRSAMSLYHIVTTKTSEFIQDVKFATSIFCWKQEWLSGISTLPYSLILRFLDIP